MDGRRCGGFDMTLVEFYSILLTQDPSSTWSLEGYKRHNLSGKHGPLNLS